MTTAREIHAIRRPRGMVVADDMALLEVQVPELSAGQVQVRAVLVSIDPYIRLRMDSDQPIGVPLMGGGIGRVVRSRHAEFHEGDLVRHQGGMRELFNAPAESLTLLNADPDLPLSIYTHALGGTGLTAYGGLLKTGALQRGEQVFVSSAAGAVGSVAAQIAKLMDCYVVGSTGSVEKARWLRDEVGLDAVINYKAEPLDEALARAAPRGLDVYFDNVGGDHLDAALACMNEHGRVPVCGMISTYNGAGEPVRNLNRLMYGRIRIEGFLIRDLGSLNDQFLCDMTAWVKNGLIRYRETVLDGFERIPEGLIGLFEGANFGKMLVRAES